MIKFDRFRTIPVEKRLLLLGAVMIPVFLPSTIVLVQLHEILISWNSLFGTVSGGILAVLAVLSGTFALIGFSLFFITTVDTTIRHLQDRKSKGKRNG